MRNVNKGFSLEAFQNDEEYQNLVFKANFHNTIIDLDKKGVENNPFRKLDKEQKHNVEEFHKIGFMDGVLFLTDLSVEKLVENQKLIANETKDFAKSLLNLFDDNTGQGGDVYLGIVEGNLLREILKVMSKKFDGICQELENK